MFLQENAYLLAEHCVSAAKLESATVVCAKENHFPAGYLAESGSQTYRGYWKSRVNWVSIRGLQALRLYCYNYPPLNAKRRPRLQRRASDGWREGFAPGRTLLWLPRITEKRSRTGLTGGTENPGNLHRNIAVQQRPHGGQNLSGEGERSLCDSHELTLLPCDSVLAVEESATLRNQLVHPDGTPRLSVSAVPTGVAFNTIVGRRMPCERVSTRNRTTGVQRNLDLGDRLSPSRINREPETDRIHSLGSAAPLRQQ
ncbi:hypothetical protein Bbelb_012190 [Branchiostoma belcheri]|nr:hypothetical protein Bbelb_012190 [Branchiostoma belcheri]